MTGDGRQIKYNYQRIHYLKLNFQRAIDESADTSLAEELEYITRMIVADPSSDSDEKRRHMCLRSRVLVALINCSSKDKTKKWVDHYVSLLERCFKNYSPLFNETDLRTKLLSMKRFLAVAFYLTLVEGDILIEHPSLREYHEIFLETRKRCRI